MSDTDLAFRATLDGSGFAAGLGGMQSSLNGFGSSLGSATGGISGLAGSLGMVASPAGIAAAGLTAVGAGLAASISTAGDFQQKMAGVNAILGGSAADMQTLSTAAREAGASTSFSASQAADALGYMAGAGWDVQDSTAALKDTLTLAAAGGMDLAAAGDLMTGTVAQFGLAATDAGRVSNVLAAGASATNTSVSQLGAGMTVVGSTANAFGMSLESTTAALGKLSNANIKGAEGGTALRGILASLASQSGTATAALAELGVTNEQINPEFVSLSDAMQLLQDRGMTATQAIQIFGRENVSAATYMAAHASELDGLEQSITGTGKASEMAATMTDTYQGAMGELSSAVEEAEIALGSVLLPVITQTIDLMAAGVTAATDFGKSISDAYTEFQTGTLAELDESFLGWMGVDTGEATAEGIATGIENESGQVADAIGDATGGADALAAVASSGADTGEEWVKNFGDAAEKGMTLVNGTWTSQAAAVADKITEQTVYLGEEEAILQRISTTQGAYYKLLDASTGEIKEASGYMRYSNLLQTPEAWALDFGYSTTKMTEASDVYLDFAKNLETEMESAGKEIGDALTEGIVPDTDTIQSSIDKLKTLQLYDPEEFSEQGGENALAYLGAVQDALDSYEAAKIEYQMDPDNENAEQNLKTTRDNLQMILDANPLSVEVETQKWGEFDTKSLSELIYDPDALKKTVVDVDRFWEGTMLPDIKSKAESAKEAWESGQVTQDDIYTSLIEPLEALDEYTPDSIEALNELFQTGQIDISEYVDALNSLSSAADSVSESISKSSSEASEMIAGLYSGTSGTSTNWMDYVNEEGGFVGPTKYYEEYADWKAEEMATAQSINEKYGITAVGSISMEIEADASPAKSESDTLISEIETSDPTMTVLMDTTVADARFQNLYNLIVNSNPVVTVQLDFAMDDIRAIIESEVRAALK